MTLVPHRAVLFTAIFLASSTVATVARAQEPAPEAPVSTPPAEGGVASGLGTTMRPAAKSANWRPRRS